MSPSDPRVAVGSAEAESSPQLCMRLSREISNGGKLTVELRLHRRLKERGQRGAIREQAEVPGLKG